MQKFITKNGKEHYRICYLTKSDMLKKISAHNQLLRVGLTLTIKPDKLIIWSTYITDTSLKFKYATDWIIKLQDNYIDVVQRIDHNMLKYKWKNYYNNPIVFCSFIDNAINKTSSKNLVYMKYKKLRQKYKNHVYKFIVDWCLKQNPNLAYDRKWSFNEFVLKNNFPFTNDMNNIILLGTIPEIPTSIRRTWRNIKNLDELIINITGIRNKDKINEFNNILKNSTVCIDSLIRLKFLLGMFKQKGVAWEKQKELASNILKETGSIYIHSVSDLNDTKRLLKYFDYNKLIDDAMLNTSNYVWLINNIRYNQKTIKQNTFTNLNKFRWDNDEFYKNERINKIKLLFDYLQKRKRVGTYITA